MASVLKILSSKANLCIRLFLWTFLFYVGSPSHAKIPSDSAFFIAYNQYMDFELDLCEQSLNNLPSDSLSHYLKILLSSTRIFINDDYEFFKAHKYIESEQLNSVDELLFTKRFTNFLRSEIKLQWAVLKLKNGEEFSAFWNLRQAYNLAQENVSKYPEFLPSYKTLGILHVLYGVLPDKYNWVLSLLGIKGDVKAGLSELDKVGTSGHFMALEANIIVSLLHAYLLNDQEKSTDRMSTLYQKNEHLIVDYAYVSVLMKNSQSNLALDILESAEKAYGQPFKIPQLYYVYGELLLQKGLPGLAIKYYETFLGRHQGKNLVKDAYFKIGICYLMNNDFSKSEGNFTKSKENGWTKNETDKNANLMLESDAPLSVDLLRIRYATDGGYYEDAFNILAQLDTNQLPAIERCESYYRSARLYHKIDEIGLAIGFYKKTIEVQKDKDWYFAPNSALLLGLIYTSQGDNAKAEKSLKLINEYSGFPYQNSIRQKAKVALRNLP